MKILHITATPLKDGGGIPVVIENLVIHQNQVKGVQSRFLSVGFDNPNYLKEYYSYETNIERIQAYISNMNPHVIIFHGVYFIKHVEVAKKILKQGYKYYIEPHSSFGEIAQRKSRTKKTIANNLFFKSFISNAKGYIFLNLAEQRNSIFNTNNDLIIPNGIDPIEKDEIKKVITDDINLYYIGRIDFQHKGLDLLFKELRKLDSQKKNIKISLYGYGDEKSISRLKREVNSFKNLSVEYYGPIYDEQKKEMLMLGQIMILTSRYEGFPMTVLEALSYGNPCIVTTGTNVRDIIEENSLGWGTDTDNIATTIDKAVLDYKKNYLLYSKRTSEYVQENYSWEIIAKKSVELLSE